MFVIIVVSLLSVAIVVRENVLKENLDKNVLHNAQKHLTTTFYKCHHSNNNNAIAWALVGTDLTVIAIIWHILDIVYTMVQAACLIQALGTPAMRVVGVVYFWQMVARGTK